MSDDDEILERLRTRPEDGARLLVGAYGRRLYAAAMRLCHNETDAEDLAPQKTAPYDAAMCALSARTDMGSKCEYTARLLEKEVSRKAAMTFLANVCTTDGI